MGRRKKDDVFLIGDEHLDADTQDPGAPAGRLADDQEPGGAPPPGLGHPASRGARNRRRWLAGGALALPVLAALAVLELGSGNGEQPGAPKTSPRPALIQAPGAAAPSMPHLAHRPTRPPGRPRPTAQRQPEPEREPEPIPMAPASSPPLPVAEAAPAPTPPSPPPPSSGGGPGGVEDFGFER